MQPTRLPLQASDFEIEAVPSIQASGYNLVGRDRRARRNGRTVRRSASSIYEMDAWVPIDGLCREC